jgi:ribosomal protein S18 acetylase RimI-like enzyme
LATGQPIGAVWLRLLQGADRGYAHVDDGTPELSIAVLPGHRGQGVGTRLLEELFASECGDRPVSLSVTAGNPARRLYERLGFLVVASNGTALTMWRAG